VMAGFVEGIFLAPGAGAKMKSVRAATALQGCGLKGDRYCASAGSAKRPSSRPRTSTISSESGVGVKHGEHRRNVVTRGISLKTLRRGERFRVGELAFEYRGPRSVCRYIERLTEPGMTQALKGRGGICAMVVENGTLRVADEIEVL
jgi:MOSC domain-containing protein YiiM